MKVTYHKARTLNLGNYESLRVEVGIELDCADGDENATFERLKDWVNGKLQREEAAVKR